MKHRKEGPPLMGFFRVSGEYGRREDRTRPMDKVIQTPARIARPRYTVAAVEYEEREPM